MNIHEAFKSVKHCGQTVRSKRTDTIANQYMCYKVKADTNSVCYLLSPAMTLTLE